MRLLALAALAVSPHVTTASPVTALAVAADRVAYATADCRVHLWDLRARRVTTFRPGPACERTSTGTGVSAISVAGSRVLFLHYTGGNIREWSLWTATPSSPTPRQIAFATTDPEAAPPIVLGSGLAYAVGPTVTVLRPDGSRASRWSAPAVVSALAGAVVATADGAVYRNGTRLATFAQAPSAIAVSRSGVVAQVGRTLETAIRTFTLARGTRLAGVDGDGAVRTVDVATGAGALVARGSLAAASGGRVVTATGRRVTVASSARAARARTA